ncbi:unnamed protein product [Urochloa humidicola]
MKNHSVDLNHEPMASTREDRMADRLDVTDCSSPLHGGGNEASSTSFVAPEHPVRGPHCISAAVVFGHLKDSLQVSPAHATTIDQVAAALDKMEFMASLAPVDCSVPSLGAPASPRSPGGPVMAVRQGELPTAAAAATAMNVASMGQLEPAVDDLFITPAPPLVQNKPPRAPRKKRTFDMTAVRRSARLANKPAVPSLQRAQRNLLRKLGLEGDETTPIEEVIRDYVKSIQGPLPDYIIAALATLLDLDDDDAEQMTAALLQHIGDGIDDLQAEQDDLLEQGV